MNTFEIDDRVKVSKLCWHNSLHGLKGRVCAIHQWGNITVKLDNGDRITFAPEELEYDC